MSASWKSNLWEICYSLKKLIKASVCACAWCLWTDRAFWHIFEYCVYWIPQTPMWWRILVPRSAGSLNTQKGAVQFSSVAQSCPTLCNPMDCSTPGFPVHHQFLKLAQTHIHQVVDAIQPSHPLSSPSPPAFNLSQIQGLFKWVSSSHQVAKVLAFQLQHRSFQRIFRTDVL